jgi:hypothetical protein
MVLDVAEHEEPKGRFAVIGATPDAIARMAPEDCDGVLTRWFDEPENPELCRAFRATGRWWFDAKGQLWQDANHRPAAPGVEQLPEKPAQWRINPARDLQAELDAAQDLDATKAVVEAMLDRQQMERRAEG